MTTTLLSVSGLCTGYSGAPVLNDVGLSVNEREIVAIVGANGAGKSTLMMALLGLLPAWRGSILFAGNALTRMSTFERVRAGLTLVPERRQLFGDMSVEENLLLGAYSSSGLQDRQHDLLEQYRRFPRLQERRLQRARLMSGGEQQIAAIARALMARPRLLLLDEPSLGLSPRWVRQVMDLIEELRQGGMAILLVEQNAREALELADRGYVIETGRMVRDAAANELLVDKHLADTYLGGGADGMEARLRLFRASLKASVAR